MTSTAARPRPHLPALRRFAIAITVLNILGHTVLGFEQSLATPIVGLITAYGMEILLESIDAYLNRRRPRYLGNLPHFVDFLLSAHITGLAVAMLLYANDRLWPICFAVSVAIGSKAILRVPIGKASRHIYNPSNFGITVTLLLFPWIGIAQPYMFTEDLHGAGKWILPAIIVISGSYLNIRLTRRGPLIAGWLTCFALQAFLRSHIFGTPLVAPFLPMTGMAYLLYSFYMVTDPATTPDSTMGQILFGASVAATYGLLLVNHIVFGLFFALTIVSTLRGLLLYARSLALHAKAVEPGAEAVLVARSPDRERADDMVRTSGQ
jgi:Na+-translocating ferredoxin:NAD+ oxidoreductase RnfD subunit